jgi:hypothetical protein
MGSKVTTQSVANPADQRVQMEGSLGAGAQFIAPAATVANPGSVASNLGSMSTLKQTFTSNTTGLTSADVRQMMLDQEIAAGENVKQVTQLSTKALEASSAVLGNLSAGRAAGTLSMTEPAASADWTKLVPYGIVGLFLLAMLRRKT